MSYGTKSANVPDDFKNLIVWILLIIVAGSMTFATAQSRQFVHPGGLYKLSDLERMRYQIEHEIDPWYTSFQELRSYARARYDYEVRGNPSWTVVNRDPCNHCSEFETDATAAFLNAIMWGITQDERHAEKAVEIFNTWKNLTEFTGGGTEPLNAGLFVWKLVEAAEIIKHTYDGWSESDIQEFSDMLVYPGYSNTERPSSVNTNNGTFYWRIYNGDPGRHGNQDLIAWRGMITMAVFLDNEIMFDRALRYFRGLPHREDDIPYVSGPSVSTTQVTDNQYFTQYNFRRENSIPDYGYNGVLEYYIWENGQNQESSRDQQHAFFGLASCAGIAEVAWNQGDPVWNYLDNRLLKGFEFAGRYNTSFIQSFPDQPQPWEPEVIQRLDRTGRWFTKDINPYFDSDFNRLSRGDFAGSRPIYEQGVAHFTVRMGLEEETIWTMRSRDVAIEESGYESNGWSLDHPGWGAVTFRRPPHTAGDPIRGFANGVPQFKMNVIPLTLEAENFDYFPDSGEGHVYGDATPANTGGGYRTDEGVDIQSANGGYAISDIQAGEWLNYTVHAPATGPYVIYIHYAASAAGGTVRFAFGENDVTTDVPVPFGAPYSAGENDWASFAVDTVNLDPGVQSMRVYAGGTDGVYRLDKISVVAVGDTPVRFRRTDSWFRLKAEPGSNVYTLKFLAGGNNTRQVYLYHFKGSLLKHQEIRGDIGYLDVGEYPQGLYVLHVTDSSWESMEIINVQ